MTTLSVAVIGAGPAGTTTARLLAAQGARVVIVEGRTLPRPKTCGGALSPKAQRLVPPSVLDAVGCYVARFEVRSRWLPGFVVEEPGARMAMVERSAFDLSLANAAAAAGAEIRDGEHVDSVAEHPQGVTIRTRRGRLDVDVAVAADGDPSAVARDLRLGGHATRRSFALDIDLPLASTQHRETGVLSFDVPGGFAWYFPKGDHANVGVGSCRLATRRGVDVSVLRVALERFVTELGLDVADGRISGHWLPQGLRRGPLASRRVLLAGDAAATVDPLFGEGISYAISSGVVAAHAIADMASGAISDLRVYDERLRAVLEPAFRRLRLAALVAQRSTTLALSAYRLNPWIRTYTADVLIGRGYPFAIDSRLPRPQSSPRMRQRPEPADVV